MITETWVPIIGYEGLYEVSRLGRIRRLIYRNKVTIYTLPTPTLVKASRATNGYRHVSLCKDGRKRTRMVHLIVLESFVGPCPDGMEAAHQDGDHANNVLDNLRWATHADNEADKRLAGTTLVGERANCAKLTSDQVLTIRSRANTGESSYSIAQDFAVNPATIQRIVRRLTWTHI